MALSYSLMIVLEVLILLPIFSYVLLSRRKLSVISIDRRLLTVIGILLFTGSAILFLVPKINLIYDYQHTKLTVDAWDHYIVTKTWGDTGVIQTEVYPYYSILPLTYIPQIVLHQATSLSLFDSMTFYYLAVGTGGLFVMFGIAGEIITGSRSERIIFAGISGIVYSFLQYFNLLFAQQYPLAMGTVAGLLCIYGFILMTKKRKRAIVYLSAAAVILALSHPFTAIFMSILFLMYFVVNKVVRFRPDPYQGHISRRIALFMSLITIVAGMTYSAFAVTGTFESGVRWSELNLRYAVDNLSSELFESTTSGVGRSFEGRYQDIDTIIYALNWALPTASSISVLIFYLSYKLRVGDSQTTYLLFPLAIMSTLMFIMTFLFSFVEFAFSRYFGAFALAFNIPLTSYLIFQMVKIRFAIIRYPILAIVGLAIIASVTDPTMLPNIAIGDAVLRSDEIYPTELGITAWDDFYMLAAHENKLVQTNLEAGPIRHYRVINDYQNEIVMNPRNYTSFNDNAYWIIDKTRMGPTAGLDEQELMDRVYDNSQVYFSK